MRRVVVTGIGMVSPVGANADDSWSNLLAGKSGATRVTRMDVSDMACQVGCEVKTGDGSNGTFNCDDWMDPKDQRRCDTFIRYGYSAAKMAVRNSGWEPKTDEEHWRTGVLIGSGIGGLPSIEATTHLLAEKGPRRVSPFFIPGSLINLVSGMVSIEFGFKGPNHSVVTACSTGAHAIGDAARIVALDDADVMIAGGAEAAISRIGYAGFQACKALSTHFNDTPEKASRPYDQDRDGFVMGEGAGVVVLEEYEHAKSPRRDYICRGRGLRHVRRRISYHCARGRWRRRLSLHDSRFEAGGNFCLRSGLRKCPRHLDTHGRRDRA